VTPRGREIGLVAMEGDGSTVFRYTQTQLPGDYRVRFTNSGAPAGDVPFHVAYDASESTIDILTDVARDNLLVPAGVQFAGANARAVATRDSAPRSEPFWGVLLAALVALLVGELLMSTWLARQRSGMAVSTN
ncbi:MAG TPA: hypothetical protein VGK58_19860, partial [Lacipirellulaceae bacterium]